MSHLSYFSDDDDSVNNDEDNNTNDDDDNKEHGWELIDTTMAKYPSPRTPGKTGGTPARKSTTGIEDHLKNLSVAAVPSKKPTKYNSFNFEHRFIQLMPATNYLDDGTCQVLVSYLINTMPAEHFNVTVSDDGMSLKLQMKIPRAFVDLGARARAEFDVTYKDTRVIMSACRSTVDDVIKALGPDFDNIWSPGQIDSLPFACRTNPMVQVMWHPGDETLRHKFYHDFRIDSNAKHQMMPILRVTLVSKEVQRKSIMRADDAVVHMRSSHESADCAPPPPPGGGYPSPGPKGFGSGGRFFPPGGGATAGGGNNNYTSNNTRNNINGAKSVDDAFIEGGITSNNSSPRKDKRPRADEEFGQQEDEEQYYNNNNNDGDANMLGKKINLVEDYYAGLDQALNTTEKA